MLPALRWKLVLFALLCVPVVAQDDRRLAIIHGTVQPQLKNVLDRGRVDPSRIVHQASLILRLSRIQQAALDQLLEDQRDPQSPNFRNWLTPEQFGERFGPSRRDMDRLTAWLESGGLTIDNIARGRAWIEFSGTAEQIESAFHTELHSYEAGGEMHFANTREISIPDAFSGLVSGIRGLHDFVPKPLHRAQKLAVRPQWTSGGSHYLAPGDLATIYNIGALHQTGMDGTGQNLAIAGQTQISLADVQAFRSHFQLPANDPRIVLYGVDPGVRNGDALEAMLDLEWSGAVARNAHIIYVYSGDVFSSVMHTIDDNLAPVLSVSYGACEQPAPFFQALAQQGNAEGITWINASGDDGAAACGPAYGPLVLLPANVPEVTAVGGTELSDQSGGPWWSTANVSAGGSALSRIPEKAWNLSGGGASQYYGKPSWQNGPGVPDDGARDVPDVALAASTYTPYLVYESGWWSVGGTSASSPAFAGIVTLLNQYLIANGYQAKAGVGNINPALYHLAQNSVGIFHDITAGDNLILCDLGTEYCSTGTFGYQAGPGYDLVTGLGSIDAFNLVTRWNGQATSLSTTLSLIATPDAIPSHGLVQITAIVTPGSGGTPPSGTLSMTLGNTTLGSPQLIPWGTSGMATVVIRGESLAEGLNMIAATFLGNANFSNSSATVPVMVADSTPATISMTAVPDNITAAGSTQLTVTVRPPPGQRKPVGSVTFLLGSTTLGTAPLMPAGPVSTASFSLAGDTLQPGDNTVRAIYQGSGGPSQTTVTVTLTPGG